MPVYELGLDDGRKIRVDADDEAAALAGAQSFLKQEGAKAPSGAAAGLMHGVRDTVSGNSETAKQFLGVGQGGEKSDPNYVPANITGGSINPLKWNYSQIPQKIAEGAPGLTQDILAGTAAAKTAKGVGAGAKASLISGLVGGALSAWSRTAGHTAKEAAADRTGNPDAEPEAQDRLRGGLTAGAASAVGAATPARFIPGMNRIGTVGAQGALDAAKKYLATTAIGAGSAGASDAVTQAGLTVGTEKGLRYDPDKTLEAAVGGGLTAGAMATPRGVSDVARASSLREFGGANKDATANYATRLRTAGDGELGNAIGGAKKDATAHEAVKADLRNELTDAARNVRRDVPLTPDVDNALQRAQTGGNLTPKDISLIERGVAQAPDGANAAYLARTMRIAQQAEQRGSYSSNGWAGGVSGVMDANLGFMLNPARLAGGTVATALGMHVLGLGNPMIAGSIAGAYGGARILDGIAGTRSPAQTFANHFATSAARLRLPSTPQAAPAAPQGGPASPWGPRPPTSGPTGPQVAPPGAPPTAIPPGPWGARPTTPTMPTGPQVAPPGPAAPQAPQLNLSPIHLNYLKQQLKNGLPPSTPEPPPQAPPETGVPKAAMREIKAKMDALKWRDDLRQRTEGQQAAEAEASRSHVIAEQGGMSAVSNPQMTKRASQLLSAASALRKLRAAPPEEAPQAVGAPAAPQAAQAPQGIPKDVAAQSKALMQGLAKVQKMKAAAEKAEAPKITKDKNGNVKSEGGVWDNLGDYEPIPADRMKRMDMSHDAQARQETEAYLGNKPQFVKDRYYESVRETLAGREAPIRAIQAQYPQYSAALEGLLMQLYELGSSRSRAKRAINHYANFMSPEAGAALRKQFEPQLETLWQSK